MITRGGNQAAVYSYDGVFPYTLVGAYSVDTIFNDKKVIGWIPAAWRANGRLYDHHDSKLDLILT